MGGIHATVYCSRTNIHLVNRPLVVDAVTINKKECVRYSFIAITQCEQTLTTAVLSVWSIHVTLRLIDRSVEGYDG